MSISFTEEVSRNTQPANQWSSGQGQVTSGLVGAVRSPINNDGQRREAFTETSNQIPPLAPPMKAWRRCKRNTHLIIQ